MLVKEIFNYVNNIYSKLNNFAVKINDIFKFVQLFYILVLFSLFRRAKVANVSWLAEVGDLVSQMYKLKTELPSTKPTLKFA